MTNLLIVIACCIIAVAVIVGSIALAIHDEREYKKKWKKIQRRICHGRESIQ